MIWGIKNNERIKATPKDRAICPLCNNKVIAKCGKIKIWHWAHKKGFECDSFGEPETKWHIKWKNYFNKEFQEVIIENHRADIKNKRGVIIELQNSPISPDEIMEREKFYGNMVWILNGKTLGKNLKIINKEDHTTFNWKWYPKSINFIEKPLYIDFGLILLRIRKNKEGKGWGILLTKEKFLREFI